MLLTTLIDSYFVHIPWYNTHLMACLGQPE